MTVLVVLGIIATLLPILLYKPFIKKARTALANAPEDAEPARIAMPILFSYTIISLAGGDTLGIVALVGYLITQEQAALWAVGLALLVIVRLFPTRGAWNSFLENVESTNDE